MTTSPFNFCIYLMIILQKAGSFVTIERNYTLVEKFLKKIGDVDTFGSQNHISVISPGYYYNSMMKVTLKKSNEYHLLYKDLFPNQFASVLKSIHEVNKTVNNSPTLYILPFILYNSSKLCELIHATSVNEYNTIMMNVNNPPKHYLKMVLSNFCNLNYKSNFFLYYEVNTTTVLVDEIYKINPNDSLLVQKQYFRYDIENDLIDYILPKEKLKRRNDLKGIAFDGVAKPFKPYVIHKTEVIKDEDEITNINIFDGMFIEIMSELEIRLNFSVTLNFPHKKDYNKVVNMISKNEKDMAIGVFSFTYDRSKIIDFSSAIHEDKSALLYLKKDFNVKWASYARPFYPESWSAVCAHVIFTAVAIVVFSSINRDFTVSYYLSATTGKAFLFSVYSTIAKRFPTEPDSIACRIAFVTISFAGFILISLYRAMLGASLAITKEHPPINSMEEVLDSDYDIITMGGTNYEAFFTKADKDSYLYTISKKKLILENWDSDSPMAAILLNILKTRKSNVLVLVDNAETPSHHPELACHFSKIDEEYSNIGVGFIFQKHWPFTQVINYHMLKILEDGSLERIRQRWLPKAMLCNEDSIEPSNILDIFTLVVVLIIGGIIAMVSLLIEFGYKNASNPY